MIDGEPGDSWNRQELFAGKGSEKGTEDSLDLLEGGKP